MGKDNKKSIIQDALIDHKAITEAAEVNAQKKLAEKFPDKFQEILKEEANNNTKSENESYKKIDDKKESNILDESDDKNKKSVMKKNKTKKEVIKEEREKNFTADVEGDTPNLGKGETEKGDTFKDTITKSDDKPISNLQEEKEDFDITDLNVDDAEKKIDCADDNDEISVVNEIEETLNEMEQQAKQQPDSDPFTNLASLKNKLTETLSEIDKMQEQFANIEEQKNQGGKQNYTGRENGGPTTQMIDEEEVDEQKNQGGKQNYTGRENGGPTTQMIDEEDVISDSDIDSVMGEQEVTEASGMAHSSSKHVAGDHLPGKDFAPQRHKRYGSVNNQQNEGKDNKKYASLIAESKKLTKKINESKKYQETVTKIMEGYKGALEKFRTQLQEMAVFNTNLAYANNLLMNENFALTQEDKIKIVNVLKEAKSISDSKSKYNGLLTEMKKGSKTINETVEDKVNGDSVQPSSKQTLDEVIENTAYENNEHVQKIRGLVEYLEKNDKKKII
jgi:hypothetical protein